MLQVFTHFSKMNAGNVPPKPVVAILNNRRNSLSTSAHWPLPHTLRTNSVSKIAAIGGGNGNGNGGPSEPRGFGWGGSGGFISWGWGILALVCAGRCWVAMGGEIMVEYRKVIACFWVTMFLLLIGKGLVPGWVVGFCTGAAVVDLRRGKRMVKGPKHKAKE